MALLTPPTPIIGQVGILPNAKFMSSTDSLATITTAGYLNQHKAFLTYPVSAGDFIFGFYSATKNPTSGTFGIFTVSVSTAGVITLAEYSASTGVNATLPTTVGHIATYSNTIGDITEDPAIAYSLGTIAAGINGTAGNFVSFPGTADSGQLTLQATANSAQINAVITNTSLTTGSGPICTYVLPPITTTANFLVSDGTQALEVGASIAFDKSAQAIVAGNVTSTTQSGVLTTEALTTAQYALYNIVMTNSIISATSTILLTVADGTNTTEGFIAKVVSVSSEAAIFAICNLNSSALNGTVKLHYTIF